MAGVHRILLSAALLSIPIAAGADVYAFVDAQGVTHFSNNPADSRYELVLRSPPTESQARVAPRPSRAARYESVIAEAAAAAELDPRLLHAVIRAESDYVATAVSPRGASGLMQLMPATAREYGADDPFDPAQNVAAGARYLRVLFDRYDGDIELVLAAYNAGEAAVDRHGRAVPPFEETRRYVPKVLAFYRSAQAAESRT